MADQTLAVKYRPHTFEDVVEQGAIIDILTDQIKTGTFKQAYLFCGPAGCGKTTAARIFANDINNGKGNPIEVDAASNNGVDNVREIIDGARRKALDSDYKVYIIDECHMLSTGAWNAMLKLLEEPPKTTVFILCTTDPQKIPATIISRVQRYNFSKISLDSIIRRLFYIVDCENADIEEAWAGKAKESGQEMFESEPSAIAYIAKMADGGMRDAITMLDKCMSLSYVLNVENVVRALGTVDYQIHFDLLLNISTGAVKTAVQIVEEVYNSGKDLKQFIKQFQYFVLDVCKYKMFGGFEYINIPDLPEYRDALNDEDLERDLSVLDWVRGVNSEIKWESNPKAIVQTAIILYGKENPV